MRKLIRRSICKAPMGPYMEAVRSDRYNYYCTVVNSSYRTLYLIQKKNCVFTPYTAIHITDKQMDIIENSRGSETVILNSSLPLAQFSVDFRCGIHTPLRNILKVYTNKKYIFIRVIKIHEKAVDHFYDGAGNPTFKWAFTVRFELL